MDISRRCFITGVAAATAGCATTSASNGGRIDETLAVLLSDVHVGGKPSDPRQQLDKLTEAVDEILTIRPLPAHAIVFGDISLLHGRKVDYERSAPQFKRLSDAGINVVFGMGNHDHRKAFFEQYPDEAPKSLVPGYAVYEVRFPDVDLLMIDSLWEDRSKPEVYNPVPGFIEKPVWDFLAKDLPSRTRPVIICSHHHYKELRSTDDPNPDPKNEGSVKWKNIVDLLNDSPAVKGFIHGHNHRWYEDHIFFWHTPGSNRMVRTVCLPSVGHWGDLGYAVLRTAPGCAVVDLHQEDFSTPSPLKKGAEMPPEWVATIEDHRGASCTFAW